MSLQRSTTQGAEEPSEFRRDLAVVLNRHSKENGSNTPDMILADYLAACLENYDQAVKDRERWYGIESVPGEGTRKVVGER